MCVYQGALAPASNNNDSQAVIKKGLGQQFSEGLSMACLQKPWSMSFLTCMGKKPSGM